MHKTIVYYLNENQAMRHIARKAGVQMTVAAGETDGWLELLLATPLSLLIELIGSCWFPPPVRKAGPA